MTSVDHNYPQPPTRLRPAARALWDKHGPALYRKGRLTPRSAPAFARLVNATATLHKYRAQLQRGGWIVIGQRVIGRSGRRAPVAALRYLELYPLVRRQAE